MALKNFCTPRQSVFASDRRAAALSLDAFLSGQISGAEFFEENYFTTGMRTLVDRALRQVGGEGSGHPVFLLSDVMGGGKTHCMIALGLLARDPELRRQVMGAYDPAPSLGPCRVVGFDGRRSEISGGIWGSFAGQMGRAADVQPYVSPMLSPPARAWLQNFGTDPTIVFFDNLISYFKSAVAVPVGHGDREIIPATEIANLFRALSPSGNVCVVISDIGVSDYPEEQAGGARALDLEIQGICFEIQKSNGCIKPIENDSELYHILRRRLFSEVATDEEQEKVAASYREALREARTRGLTKACPDSLYSRVLRSYPFHPDFCELFWRFRENEGFQQTRGIIRLMQMVVSSIWNTGKAERMELIHPYDIDLNTDEIACEVRTINPSLSEAIAHDVANGGDAVAEQIDAELGNTDASDVARLVLVASLSTAQGAIHGIRERQLVDYLQRPDWNLFHIALRVLTARAWYLHSSADGRLHFKDKRNLTAKLHSTAQALHAETVDRMLHDLLDDYFTPSLRDCYQNIAVLPPLDQVQIDLEKTTLIIVRPGGQHNQLPVSADWQAWWAQQQYKNRVLFLSGSRDTFLKVVNSARLTRAVQSLEEDLRTGKTQSDDPQWRELHAIRERVGFQFTAALREAFDQIVYPSINSALRSIGIDIAFAGNQSGEATIRKMLDGAQKFITKIDDDSFRTRAEARLFGSAGAKVVLWSDFKRTAAVNTSWPLHKVSALDDLRKDCVHKGLWREESNHISRGPFPPPVPDVSIRALLDQDGGDGTTEIRRDKR